jgi:trk system potassium uptake protein
MNRFRRLGNVAGLLGTIIKWFAAVFVVPLSFAIGYGSSIWPFALPMILCLVVGLILEWRFPDSDLEMADGFILVVLSWLLVSGIGALPYIITDVDTLAHPINAFFESVSGFTCTGSTVMGNISLDTYPHAVMIWRQLTQWIGGMGILVLAVAVLPRLSVGGAQFLDNEVPGPRMDRLTPHMAETARRLWLLYVGLSALLFIILLGIYYAGLDPLMDPFQSFAHTLTTVPSGGFSPMGRSVEGFAPVVQWVLIPFMFIAAVNFALLWHALFSGPGNLFKDTEFRVYAALSLGAGLLMSLMLVVRGQFDTIEANFRHGFFQMATFLTTTGFASTDFAQWPGEVLTILVVLMFIAGCVGSTSGGLKVMRWVIVIKALFREMVQQIHPSSVRPLRMSNRVLKESVVRGALLVIMGYFILFALSLIVLSIDVHMADIAMTPAELITAITATLGNIGPGFGAVGPMESFGFFPVTSKLWLAFLMIAGRLEIMTFLVILSPWYWRD